MCIVYISMGSNLYDRMGNLRKALSLLSSHPAITVLAVSSVYETDPVGYKDQDDFLNLVCRIRTDLSPLALLDYCQTVEQNLFREKTIRFGPRTIDLDILTYDELVLQTDKLTLPHPRMAGRSFVQIPLQEIRNPGASNRKTDPAVRFFGSIPDNCWLKHL